MNDTHAAAVRASVGAWAASATATSSGALAGTCLGAVDVASAVQSDASPITALTLLGLDLSAGVLLASMVLGATRACAAANARLPLLPRESLEALCVLVLALPLGTQVFSGAGVQRTSLGTLGPWLFPPLVAALFGVAAWLVRRAFSGPVSMRATLGGVAVTAAGIAYLLDRRWLPGLYEYLHVLLALAALGGLSVALAALAPRVLAAPALAVTALLLPLATTVWLALYFPHAARAHVLSSEHPSSAQRFVAALWYLTDADDDGASSLFGGADCAAFDHGIGPDARELPSDGIDQDCDGIDLPAAPPRRDYGGSRERARDLSALARGRSTVVIVIDALRDDRVGRPEFPNLALLARESVRFNNAYAPSSSTATAVPALLTGRLLPRPDVPSAPERLRAAGKATAWVATDIVTGAVSGAAGVKPTLSYPLLRGFARSQQIASGYGADSSWGAGVTRSTDAEVTRAALALLDGPSPPDLLWVHYYDLHQWHVLQGVSGAQDFARYDAALAHVDAGLQAWLGRRDRLNLVLLADHGEGVGAHGVTFHTRQLWAELVRVPLLLRIPGVAPSQVQTPVTTTDVAPTLLDLAELIAPAEAGFSLLTLVGIADPGRTQFLQLERKQSALLDGRYRALFDHESRIAWLFDVLADPTETNNLASLEPTRARALMHDLLSMRAAAGAPAVAR